jgi:hypothetical protein
LHSIIFTKQGKHYLAAAASSASNFTLRSSAFCRMLLIAALEFSGPSSPSCPAPAAPATSPSCASVPFLPAPLPLFVALPASSYADIGHDFVS